MYRVIIVDDEPLIRKGLRATIEWDELGLELSGEASNGSEAWEQILVIKPQIVITDIKMPVMDGLELIRKLRESGSNIKVIILSGYSDYMFLKEAITHGVESYLLKPIDNDELISILKSTIKSIEDEIVSKLQQREGVLALTNNTLNRLVTNSIGLQEYKEKCSLMNIALEGSKFVAATAMIEDGGSGTELDGDNSLRLFAVFNICEEIIGRNDLGLVFISSNGEIVFLLSDGKNGLADSLLDSIFTEILNSVRQYLKLSVFIGVGLRVEAIEELYKSYDAALKCLDYRIAVKDDAVIKYAEIDSGKISLQNIKIDFELLENFIRLEEKEKLLKYIDKCFEELSRQEKLSIDHIRSFVLQIVIYAIKAVGETGRDAARVAESLDFRYSELLGFKKLGEFKAWLETFSERVIDFLALNVNKKISIAVKSTLDYVNEHYFEDISLKLVADKIYMNASYLGQVFKKEMGESFTDYVNNYRIQRAKELLTTTNLKVYEISEKVGFADSHYFIKIFKKHTGVNPSDIKKIG